MDVTKLYGNKKLKHIFNQLPVFPNRKNDGKSFGDSFFEESIEQSKALFEGYKTRGADVLQKYRASEAEKHLFQQRKWFTEAVNNLDDDLKIPYQMLMNGYRYKEIANLLQTNRRAVRKKVKDARKELKRFFPAI